MSTADLLLQFTNCRLLRDHQLSAGTDLWVRNGRIVDPERVFFDERRQADRTVNCAGAILAPGFIDLQINGAFGVDFSNSSDGDGDAVAAGVRRVACGILAHGVTAFCPTLVTSPPAVYRRVLPHIRRRPGDAQHGATVLGTHLEGPFINVEKKGAHPAECIRELRRGDDAEAEGPIIDALVAAYGEEALAELSIVTLAPEKPGALDAIAALTARGVTAALGHSMANLVEGEAAVWSGSRLITHLFNAMLPVRLKYLNSKSSRLNIQQPHTVPPS